MEGPGKEGIMEHRRITLVCGHYGSGKTNIALNLAFALRKAGGNVALADLDIVNPYFRSADSRGELEAAGIPLICSSYASSNVDLPSLPANLYAITDGSLQDVVIDVGGDDRGALALGRLRDAILEENDYHMLLVINRFRPLTRDAASTLEVVREIEAACGIPFTGIVNNSNLGEETTPEDILSSREYAQEISEKTHLPVVMTSVRADLLPSLAGQMPELFPMKLQRKPV